MSASTNDKPRAGRGRRMRSDAEKPRVVIMPCELAYLHGGHRMSIDVYEVGRGIVDTNGEDHT